jgi:ATP-dependent RNA helicase DeaD
MTAETPAAPEAVLPPLPAAILQALAEKGFETLTAVQSAVLAPGMAGRDLLVSAQTGSGKTLAFGLALASDLIGADGTLPPPATPRALVIAPTRELALQVGRELAWLYAPAGAVIAQCVGGMDPRAERRALERGAHLVVGTPGRLRDHLERGALDPATLDLLVLDEADEMLDLGFREDLEFLLAALPTPRRTLMFSATLSPEIERLAQTYMASPARVATEGRRAAHADIAYQALLVEATEAETAIMNVLRFHEARNALVFCKTRAAVNHLTARLHNRGFQVVPLSGELAQEERARALQSLRDGRARVCVATDVAARGIDLPGLDLVIHADLPGSVETLTHRSGRTGRAGRKGLSVLVVPVPARKKAARLLAQAAVSAEWTAAPTAAEVTARDTERLLEEPALTAPETVAEGGLITQLVERFTARELAAGVARMWFAARSAPEDVTALTASAPVVEARERPEPAAGPRERAPVTGPWLRLSVGAQDGAEARWLLPMLCRAGNITRDDIGAIRVQGDHTLVQLTEDGGAQFFAALDGADELDKGVRVAEVPAPDLTALRTVPARTAPRREAGERPRAARAFDGEKPRPARKAEADRPRTPRAFDPDRPRPPRAPEGDRPRPPRPFDPDRPRPPRKTEGERPARAFDPDRPRPPRAPEGDRPRPPRPFDPDRPRPPRKAEGAAPARKPRPDRPAERPAAPAPAVPAKPRIDREAAMNPSARLAPPKGAKPARFGKPGGFGGKPGGRPGGKPGGKPGAGPRPGGDTPPRRPGGPGRPRG